MASMTNKKKTSFKRTEKYQRTGYKFIAPGLLMMVLLIIYPMLYGAYLSFYNTNLVNKWKFVGFKYYLEAFTKPEFYTSVLLTFWFMILVVAGHFIIGFLLASTLNKKFHGRTIFRMIFMLPWLFPETVIALLFTWIMNPMYGVLNSILKSLGIISSNVSWLGSAKFAFPAVVAVCIWKGYPLVMTMILSGLQSISHDLYEAAEIDGANRLQQIWNITIPAIMNTILVVFILNLAKVMNVFESVFVLYNSLVYDVSDVIQTYTYRVGIVGNDYGYSTAIGLFKSVISLILVTASDVISKKVRGYGIV